MLYMYIFGVDYALIVKGDDDGYGGGGNDASVSLGNERRVGDAPLENLLASLTFFLSRARPRYRRYLRVASVAAAAAVAKPKRNVPRAPR